jgi:hypothetical protein
MNKLLILPVIALLVIASIVAVSAKTIVAGKIYDSPNFETANAVSGADINVTCDGNSLTTTSLSDGTYSVEYADTEDCPDGSLVTVVAEKDGNTNSGTGLVHDFTAYIPDIYLGIVNIALIPEFGLIVGTLTVLSAVGVFFLVRRK